KVNYITDLVSIEGLDSVIEQAFANNPSFNQVHVAFKLAYEQRAVTAASQWFSGDVGFDAQRSETEGTLYISSVGIRS
ncbi:TolC family protein, partial [Pseudoalteromonas aliena]